MNALTGQIPRELGALVDLRSIKLDHNRLTGPIPTELGNLANLEGLHLRVNALTGPIPSALGRLSNLKQLDLGVNALTGPIPSALGNLKNLEALQLFHTWGLSGSLPAALLRLSRLEELDTFVTQTCAPVAWQDWLATIRFFGRLCGAGTDATIDVAVVYTSAAREAAGSVPAIEALVDLLIAETNEAYEASGVHHRVALVARSEVRYAETGNSFLDLDRLENPSDGHMDEVHAMRDRTGADLVHLIFHQGSFPGIAVLGGAFGLTCVNCDGLTFAHELGHNMGLLHDRYAAGGSRHPTGRLGRLAHPAYGYVNQRALEAGAAASSRWHTIMAYGDQCADAPGYFFLCPRLPRFSNPRQRYNGDPLGIPYGEGGSGVTGPADAVAVLNVAGPAVALWRDRPPGANRPPTAVGTLPDRELDLRGVLTVDASLAFVDPDGDPLTYTVSSSTHQVVTVQAAGARVTLAAVSAGTATIRVTATDPGGLGATQTFMATVHPAGARRFTDDPIVPGVTPVRAVHFTELRTRIDVLRGEAGLQPFRWTDPVLRSGVTRVRLAHLLELREALAAAYASAGRAAPPWTDAAPVVGTTPIRAVHLTELRVAVLALE